MNLVIAIVGRPNVGKSTLFNRLTRSRDALVADLPGLTRDRQYGEGKLGDGRYLVIDTGGLNEEAEAIDELMTEQTALAIAEADVVCLLVDAQVGLTTADELTAQQVRAAGKPVYLVVNKVDGRDADVAAAEFSQLGLGELYSIAALHGRGVKQLITTILAEHSAPEMAEMPTALEPGIKFAVVGRPNVGKSTLVNRMLGEERVVVFDAPGTTRDSIYIPMERQQQRFTIIDTAGVRRRSRVARGVEKFSVVKTLQAIEAGNVVSFLIDAREGVTDQDLHLLGFIIDAGRAVVLAVNKWDGLSQEQKQNVRSGLDRQLRFLDFARVQFISALHGTGVGDLFAYVNEAYQSASKELSTQRLTRILEDAVTAHPPPLVRGRRIKLRYAHPGGANPPIIVIHGNQTAALPHSYQRYLVNVYRKALALVGTPVRLEFKTGENPYAGRRNKLTPRQERRRKRLMRHVKKR